jgi:hypothetical protein
MNQEEDGHSVHSSSTQTSDLADCDEEFDLNPLPTCNGTEEQEELLTVYLSSEGLLNIFHQGNRPTAVSPESDHTGPSVTSNDMMAKLGECMNRSALSRSLLVETFCQSSLKKRTSASKAKIHVSSSTMAMKKKKKRGGRIQANEISVVKASASQRSAKEQHKSGSFLQKKSKHQKPSADSAVSNPSKENDDFRASGIKLTTKALITKFKCLKRGDQHDGNRRIASFLRREKLKSTLIQTDAQAAC